MPESAELRAVPANRFGPNSSRPTGSFRQGQNGKNQANTRWGQIRASKGAKSRFSRNFRAPHLFGRENI
jgi:hypothetical protein